MTFRERYMTGETGFDEIFDLTDKWNFSDETCTLREYLGLTAAEEDVWITESDEALEELMEKERRTKILFTDLDDTLFNSQKEVSDGNRRAINDMLAAGHYIVLSTGRALESALKLAEKLELCGENCFIIAFNGGQIYDTGKKEIVYSCPVPMDQVRFVFDEAKKFGIHVQTYNETGVVTEADSEDLHFYCQIQGLTPVVVEDVMQALKKEPPKLLIIDYRHPERVPAFREYITPLAGDKFDLFMSHPALLEMVAPGVNKGNAVHFLCDYLGIPLCNSVAAGDAENDLTMIREAHIGVAMSNGADFLKQEADYITEHDQNHDGVAEIIDKFIMND